MWKTTDHYIQQKRIKAAEAEHHLKQVYIPNYNKPNPSVLYPNPDSTNAPTGCEGCNAASSSQWYALGPTSSPLKVCAECWAYWKRYGDLKAASILGTSHDRHLLWIVFSFSLHVHELILFGRTILNGKPSALPVPSFSVWPFFSSVLTYLVALRFSCPCACEMGSNPFIEGSQKILAALVLSSVKTILHIGMAWWIAPGWGPRGPLTRWLENLCDMAKCRSQWHSDIWNSSTLFCFVVFWFLFHCYMVPQIGNQKRHLRSRLTFVQTELIWIRRQRETS